MRSRDMPEPTFSGVQSFKTAIPYDCAYCGRSVATTLGWEGRQSDGRIARDICILLCPNCGHPTYFNEYGIVPGIIPRFAPGGQFEHLPAALDDAYSEARRCMSVGAYTGCVMVCRKILMHIAVENGDDGGKHFVQYVDFLDESGLLPYDAKNWAERIKNLGNEANHQIEERTEGDALLLLRLLEQILENLYEIPKELEQHDVTP